MIVKFNDKHIKDMAEIEKECFDAPWTERMLEEELSNPYAFFFCFIEKNRVIGYIGMHKIIDEGHITNIGVKTEYRKKGIGGALIKHATDEMSAHGVNDFTLEVRVSNARAISLYEKAGFVTEGIRRKFYQNGEDAYIMWRRGTK